MATVFEERPFVGRPHALRKMGVLGLVRVAALLERQRELNLTDDQVNKLMGIRSELIRNRAKITGEIRVARLELMFSVARNIGNIQPDQLRSAEKNIHDMRVERRAVTFEAFKKATDVLSNEQKAKLKDAIVQRLAAYEAEEEDVEAYEEED